MTTATAAPTRFDSLLTTAGTAINAMHSAVDGKAANDSAATTVGTLVALAELIDGLIAELKQSRASEQRLAGLLERIATVQVRSAAGLIEAGNWKKLCGELQEIASQGAVASEAGRRSR